MNSSDSPTIEKKERCNGKHAKDRAFSEQGAIAPMLGVFGRQVRCASEPLRAVTSSFVSTVSKSEDLEP
jgi:hypothetical protein